MRRTNWIEGQQKPPMPATEGMDELSTAVYMAVGEASMCWTDIPTGVFDTDNAKRIAEDLLKVIRRETK